MKWHQVCLPRLKAEQVLKLNVALYGLKQAERCWAKHFCTILKDKIGFTRCQHDNAIYFKRLSDRQLLIIFIHVDDTSLIAPNCQMMQTLKDSIKSHLEITDGSKLYWTLGIEVGHNREHWTLWLSQKAYIDSILQHYSLFDRSGQRSKSSIPFNPATTLSANDTPKIQDNIVFMHNKPYCKALGALMYCAVITHLDIFYTVSQLSWFTSNPGRKHWTALYKVYTYLNQTKDLRLTFSANPPTVLGFSNADGMSSPNWHTMSDYVFLVDRGAVSWSSKYQELVALSTAEAEYVTITHATKEAIWLQNFIKEIFSNLNTIPFPLHSNNNVSHCTCQGWLLPLSHQTYQHLFLFYLFRYWIWQTQAHFLSYYWYDCWHFHQGPSFD